MNFCVAILILKVEENMQLFWCIMLYYFKKGKMQLKSKKKKKIFAVYGEGAVPDRPCQKWYVDFHAGNFSLDGAPRLGRRVEAIKSRH